MSMQGYNKRGGEKMKKHQFNFNVAFPDSVNSEGQQTPVIHTDPNGSYTGRPLDPEDKPVQDADDL